MAVKYLSAVDLNLNELQNGVVQLLGSDPASPVNGQVWVNSTTWVLKVRLNAVTVSLGRLDQISAPTASVAMNSQKITGLLDGTAATDAATVGQVTAASAGLDPKASVRAASTANVAGITYTATGGTSGRGQITVAPNTLDGVTLAANDRILLKNQTTGAQNGIYVVTTLGTGANGVWDRATDFDQDAEVTAGAHVFVEEGTANDNTGWVLSTNNPITIGGASGTALTFAKFSAAPSTLTKFTATGPGSTGTSWVITHSLGTSDVVVEFRDASTNAMVMVDHTMTDANTVTANFGASQTLNTLKVTVVG